MKIILISGLSGSGKSVALRLLEDVGYYCIDNMPMEMMPDLVRHHILRADVEHLAVSVDIRSRPSISEIDKQLAYLRRQGHSVELLFLESDEAFRRDYNTLLSYAKTLNADLHKKKITSRLNYLITINQIVILLL